MAQPPWSYGYVPTAGEWNEAFASKQDALDYIPVNREGDTMLGPLRAFGSSPAAAGFGINPGQPPTSPKNGDIWITDAGLFVRVNGTTVGPVINANIVGPVTSVNNNIAVWGNGTGSLLKDGGKALPTGSIVGTTDSQTLTNKRLTIQASDTSAAGLNVAPGVAPTSPANGDVWITTAGIFARVNGVTVGPLIQTPAGSLLGVYATTAPYGYLKANGSTFSQSTYPDLYAALGTNVLPDLRGEFIRGLDDGRGVDPGRTLGSAQSSQNLQHNHTITDPGHAHDINSYSSGALGAAGRVQMGSTGTAGTYATVGAATNITINNSGGTEARPRNIALLWCMKY